jgi:hypothetical protein
MRLSDLLNIAEMRRSLGDPGVPVPRDSLPPEWYAQRELEEAQREEAIKAQSKPYAGQEPKGNNYKPAD